MGRSFGGWREECGGELSTAFLHGLMRTRLELGSSRHSIGWHLWRAALGDGRIRWDTSARRLWRAGDGGWLVYDNFFTVRGAVDWVEIYAGDTSACEWMYPSEGSAMVMVHSRLWRLVEIGVDWRLGRYQTMEYFEIISLCTVSCLRRSNRRWSKTRFQFWVLDTAMHIGSRWNWVFSQKWGY